MRALARRAFVLAAAVAVLTAGTSAPASAPAFALWPGKWSMLVRALTKPNGSLVGGELPPMERRRDEVLALIGTEP